LCSWSKPGESTPHSMTRASNRKPGCKPIPAPLDEWWLYATLHVETWLTTILSE